jgi:hypothetical protein
MPPDIDVLRKTLKAESLEYLNKNLIPDENKRRNYIWRFVEKLNVSQIAKAHFVNEVHAEWQYSLPDNP